MGNNSFAPYLKLHGKFVVRNISMYQKKVIKIFGYPINWGDTRDLLQIPGVGEADLRASLLKGELQHKIRAKDIEIVDSDIDLIQFNDEQKAFLIAAGVTKGISAGADNSNIGYKINEILVGIIDQTVYKIPSGTWIQEGGYAISVYKNGVRQLLGDDYIIAESVVGQGYDTVVFMVPSSSLYDPPDVMTADYYYYKEPPV